MDSTKVQQDDYKNICRKYMEVYEEYKQHWPQLQMKIVPVDSITNWNILPRDMNSMNDKNNNNGSISENYEGLSFWETLQRFHADGYQIHCPYRIFSVESPLHYAYQAYLMAGMLKVGDLLVNSEIKLEITNISVDRTSVKVAYAQAEPLTLRLKGAAKGRSKWPRIYGPGLRQTSCFVARMIFLRSVELPLPENMRFESTSGHRQITNLTVIKCLNAITYEPIEKVNNKKLEGHIFSNEVVLVEVSLFDPICIDQESTYPDFARFYVTGKSISPYGSIVALGVVISADWNKLR